MNKLAIISAFVMLSVVVTADMQTCINDILIDIPQLERIYADYNSSSWWAIWKDLRALYPELEKTLADCMNHTMTFDDKAQECVDSYKQLVALLMPAARYPKDETFVGEAAKAYPLYMHNVHVDCATN